MILEQGKKAEVFIEGEDESIDMTIDSGSQAVLMQILSQGLYKDPIGSIVREWTSNALDSHVEAGVQEPVVVSIQKDDNYALWFSVTDYGVGISPDRVQNIISKYAASTKRNTNTMLGAFGLGLKSGLSYSDAFNFITRFEGKEYSYIMYKGEEGTKIDKLHEQDTTERNGTTFKIKIKNYDDKIEFREKCQQQLCYFESVFLDLENFNQDSFTITKSEKWKHSTLNSDDNLHLSLDNVYYAIDFNRLGIPNIKIPIAMSFNIGEGLVPTPSREDITYTPVSKKLILDRIREISDFFVGIYNETASEVDKFEDLWGKFDIKSFSFNEFLEVDLKELKKYTTLEISKPTMTGITKLDLEKLDKKKYHILDGYTTRGRINHQLKFSNKDTAKVNISNLIRKDVYYILTKQKPKGLLLDYIKDKYGIGTEFVYEERAKRKLGKVLNENASFSEREKNRNSYVEFLQLDKVPKEDWRIVITEYQSIEQYYVDKFIPIDTIVPDEKWLKERRESRVRGVATYVKKVEVRPRVARIADKGFGDVVFDVQSICTLEILKNARCFNVYGTLEQKKELHWIRQASDRIAVCCFVERDYVKLKEANFRNWITIEQFMEGKTQPFKRMVTAMRIQDLEAEYYDLFRGLNIIKQLSKDFYEKLLSLKKYAEKHKVLGYLRDEDKKILLEAAAEMNSWDTNILSTIEAVEKDVELFDFFPKFSDPEGSVKYMAEILKYRKFKLNLEHYQNLPLVEEEDVEEDELSEEELDVAMTI